MVFLVLKFQVNILLFFASMVITHIGRILITNASIFFEKNYDAITVYGDSILGDEPLVLKDENENIFIKSIETLCEKDYWKDYKNFKINDKTLKNKEQNITNLQVFSKGSWRKIKRVIRHKTCKKIFRVNTHIGVVDVTEDHSLLDEDYNQLKPENLEVNKTKLAHSYPIKNTNISLNKSFFTNYKEEIEYSLFQKALIEGFFFGDGSCGIYNCDSGIKNSWYICKSNLELLEVLLKYLNLNFGEFKILDVMKSSKVYRIVPVNNVKNMCEKFDIFYTEKREKRVPDHVLNSSYLYKLYFLKGYYLADGAKCSEFRVSNKGKVGTCGLYYLAKSVGLKCSVSCRNDKQNIFRLTFSDKLRKKENIVKKVYPIYENYQNYVFDLETEAGSFCAGIGEIDLKNTDSVMVSVPSLKNDPTKAQAIGEIMERDINGYPDKVDSEGNVIEKGKEGIFKKPLSFELEKLMRAFYFEGKKKKYMYMEYDKNGDIIKENNSDREALNVKGVILARRDNCKWMRNVYEKMIRGIFAKNTVEQVFDMIIDAVLEVIELKFDVTEELSIIKSMGSNYKSRTFALAIFSELMKSLLRPVKPGERFSYVIVNDHQKRDKVGYKMRTNEFFKEQWETHGLEYGDKVPEDLEIPDGLYPPEKIDSQYYISNVLSNQVDDLFTSGYKRSMPQFEEKCYQPIHNKRLKPVSVITPVKMVALMLKDHKKVIEEEGIEVMIPKIRDLKEWFRE